MIPKYSEIKNTSFKECISSCAYSCEVHGLHWVPRNRISFCLQQEKRMFTLSKEKAQYHESGNIGQNILKRIQGTYNI
jgi:hypothetical protein